MDPSGDEAMKKEQAERDRELDELNALIIKHDQHNVEMRDKEATEVTKRALLHDWIVDRMQDDVIKKVNTFWLEQNTSFSTSNDHDIQLEFLMTTNTFLFWWFENIVKVPMSNPYVNKKLLKFYASQSKPRYDVWTLKRIYGLKVGKPFKADEFTNIAFKAHK